MRTVTAEEIIQAVKELCIQANKQLPQDMKDCLGKAQAEEQSPLGREVLSDLIRNYHCAGQMGLPICQDTGLAIVFAEIGQDVHITGMGFEDAVNEGVRQGYTEGLLRLSVVADPLRRVNTNDNTPAILHQKLVGGEQIKLTVAPKGAGSENMSAVKMFTPAATVEDIVGFVAQSVERAGSNPCPPIVVGVGIGGDFEVCAYLSKKAVCRDTSARNPDPFYAELEERMLTRVNALGIGPQGFGGTITAMAVNVETYATHIACLPVAVNIGCHVTRHKTAVL